LALHSTICLTSLWGEECSWLFSLLISLMGEVEGGGCGAGARLRRRYLQTNAGPNFYHTHTQLPSTCVKTACSAVSIPLSSSVHLLLCLFLPPLLLFFLICPHLLSSSIENFKHPSPFGQNTPSTESSSEDPVGQIQTRQNMRISGAATVSISQLAQVNLGVSSDPRLIYLLNPPES